jgi:hypothetical protein
VMRRQVRPACPDPDVVWGLRGRYINQAGKRRCHQGSKADGVFLKKPHIRVHLYLILSSSLKP